MPTDGTMPRPPGHSRPDGITLPALPDVRVDLDEVRTRYRAVKTAGTLVQLWKALVTSVADIPPLVPEVDRLWTAMVALRFRYANLAAAARATLAAHRDGEPNPLDYLADEIRGGWPAPPEHRGGRR
jgi:hypothetical protein